MNILEILKRGGKGRVDLLNFCVFSIEPDPIFVFLVGEYRNYPTHTKAVALHESFCSQGAPARISARDVLPPLNLRIQRAIELLCSEKSESDSDANLELTANRLPAERPLFDFIVERLVTCPESSIIRIGQCYDPQRSPIENLAGSRLTEGQLAFVRNVWQPRVRPSLVAAGFYSIQTIGLS